MPCPVLVQPRVYTMPSMQPSSAAGSCDRRHTTADVVEYATTPSRLPLGPAKARRRTRSRRYVTTCCQLSVPMDPERSTTSIASVTHASLPHAQHACGAATPFTAKSPNVPQNLDQPGPYSPSDAQRALSWYTSQLRPSESFQSAGSSAHAGGTDQRASASPSASSSASSPSESKVPALNPKPVDPPPQSQQTWVASLPWLA
mmetsp:Transcript_76373/g.128317  ORF Transcript_76373/g.128317 Transcript_76373/m.128317 type:complete len:202 (-) Transcript_76373:235-840(-)